MRKIIMIAAALVLGPAAALAQQMGKEGWSWNSRNPSMAAQFKFQQKATANEAAQGAVQQFVTQYYSSSTSIGNLNQIEQILSGGSQGAIGAIDQGAHGNQGSTATVGVTQNNNTP